MILNLCTCVAYIIGVDWDKLPETDPPQILPYLPAKSKDDQALTSDYNNIVCIYIYIYAYVVCICIYSFRCIVDCNMILGN